MATEVCPVCMERLPASLLPAHCEQHFSPKPSALVLDRVECPQCGLQVALEELDSHEMAHRLQNDDVAATTSARQQHGTAVDLTASPPPVLPSPRGRSNREVTCWSCGEEGHVRSRCPYKANIPHALNAGRPEVMPTDAAIITARQQADPIWSRQDDIIPLLHTCLRSQAERLPGVQYHAILAGGLMHFHSQSSDSSWGCGWRNMQMLASHLLRHGSQEQQQALFGGAAFVPDLPSLQAWLECAWNVGFDALGASQLGWHVQGTRRWVGTTEAAALLRQFGLRAHIVDIRGTYPQRWAGHDVSAWQSIYDFSQTCFVEFASI